MKTLGWAVHWVRGLFLELLMPWDRSMAWTLRLGSLLIGLRGRGRFRAMWLVSRPQDRSAVRLCLLLGARKGARI